MIELLKTNKSKSAEYAEELLKEIYELAQEGRIASVGICYVSTDGNIGEQAAGGHDTAALLGACSLLEDTIKARFD
jgi:hypothetical protein